MIAKLRKWAALNPLARFALAALAGVSAAEFGFASGHALELFFAAAAACSLLLVLPGRMPAEISAALVFAFIHIVRLDETSSHPLRVEIGHGGRAEAVVTGYLTTAIEVGGSGAGRRQPITLDAEMVDLPIAGRRMIGRARLRAWLTNSAPLPPAGTYEIHGRLRLPEPPANPGEFDSAAYALRKGFVADLDVRSMRLIEADAFPVRTAFLRAAERCRGWMSKQLEPGIEGEAQPLSIIRGVTLGLADEYSADLQPPFRQSGTLHVFSVSGLHVALVSSISLAFLSVTGVRRSRALVIIIPAIFAYAFITGWRPPAARAALMITVFFGGVLFDRRARLQNSLGSAALLLLAIDTQPAFTAGFQLSFGVLWAIAIFAQPLLDISRPLTSLDPFLPPQLATWTQRRWVSAKLWLAGMLSVSTAATVGSLPLMIHHFGLVTPVSIIANCLLIPLAFCVLAAACVSVLLAAVKLGVVQMLSNNANWLFAKLMLGSAIFFSKLPGAWFVWQPPSSAPRPAIELTVLHLPFGEGAQHLRAGNSHWLLDTGRDRSFVRAVQPVLQQAGAAHLAGVILSHSDVEHVGGVARIFSEYPDAQAFVGIHEPWRYETGASSLKRFLASRRVFGAPPPRTIGEDDILDLGPGARATVLYPSPRDRHDRADDRALVLLLELEGFRILWCGDAGFIAEKTLIERHLLKALRCDVLIRNQHAGDFSALPEFLLAARPKVIISSNVPFIAGQTMPASLTDYAKMKHATLFDQDTAGAVTITIENQTLTATAFVTREVVTLEKKHAAVSR